MADLRPIIVYKHGPTSNPWKVIFILEELGLSWEPRNVLDTELKAEPYVSLNPNGRVPAIIDPNNNDLVLWESGAIIDYLIEEYDKDRKLHYTSSPEKHVTRCWEHFQMSGQGPYWGQKAWFSKFHHEQLPSAIKRYLDEVKRTVGVIDSHLAKQGTPYLVGDRATYADIMFLPWIRLMPAVVAPEVDPAEWEEKVHYTAWVDRLKARPAIAKALKLWEVDIAARMAASQAVATTEDRKE